MSSDGNQKLDLAMLTEFFLASILGSPQQSLRMFTDISINECAQCQPVFLRPCFNPVLPTSLTYMFYASPHIIHLRQNSPASSINNAPFLRQWESRAAFEDKECGMKPQLRKGTEGNSSLLCQQTWTETEWWPINHGTFCLLRDIWI